MEVKVRISMTFQCEHNFSLKVYTKGLDWLRRVFFR